MKTRSLLFAGVVAGLLSSPAQATTTLYKFCSDSADDSEYADNRASATSAGWIIYDPGPDSTSNDGTFSHPIRLKNSTYVTTPTYADGWAITKVIVGARSTNLARVYHVNPSVGSEQTQMLTQTGVRQELEFDFDSSEGVTSVTITTPSGTGNSYLYDVTITILKPLSTPANLALVGDEGENEFTVSWDSVSGVSSYSVTLLDALGGTVDTQSRTPSQTTATFSGLTSSTAYTVSVVAVGDGTTYDDSVAATLPVETAAPAGAVTLGAPSGFACTDFSYATASFEWQAVSGAEGYSFTLSPADGSVSVSGETATASGLSEGTSYTASVVALGNGTTTVDSEAATVSFTTLVHVQLAAPAGLASSSVTDSGFTLSWNAVANAGSYSVSVLDGNGAAAGTVSVSGTTATVTGLSADTAYTAKVQALKPSGDTPYLDSEWSDTVSVTTELADGLKRAILFNETFDKVAGAGWQYSGNIQNTDETGWSFGTDTVRGPKGIRLGTSNNPSSATTREIAVSNALDSTEVMISFLAAAYSGKTSAGTLTLIDAATDGETVLTNLTPAAMSNGTGDPLAGGTSYEVAASVPSRFKLRFESLSTASDKRLLLDSIKVTQVYDPNIQTVGAPTVSVSGETSSGFTVSWTDADENAESYDLMVTSAGGSTTNLSVSGVMSPYAVSGLAAGTVYTAFVRAVGDNLHFAPSAWASASAETEALSYDVEFSVDGSAEGPFSRTVRAGNAVSFTVAAALVSNGGTSEDVTGSISTDFPSGSFNPATGAFSWTPSEADVGTTNIGFSVTANGVAFTETVAVTVLSNYRDEPLFRETFTNVGDYSWGATTALPFPTRTTVTDNDLWSGNGCIRAFYAIRLGKTSEFGHATTPVIETKGSGPAELTLAFRCARTTGSGRVAVTVADLSGQTIYAITNTPISETVSGHNAIGAEHGMTNMFAFAAGGAFTVTFESVGDGRVGIDEIEVFQKVPVASEAVALETVHSSATSDAKTNGFTATWSAVANAEGYAVMVFDRNGAYVPGATATVDSANCRAVITGLSPSSRYYVKIKALGDGSATWDSVWSAASLADTTNPPTVISVW